MYSKLSRIFKNRLTRNAFLFHFGTQLVTIVLLLFFIYMYMSSSLMRNLKQLILAEDQEMIALFKKDGLEGLRHPPSDFFVRVLNRQGRIIFQSLPKGEGDYLLGPLDSVKNPPDKTEWYSLNKEDDEDRLIVISESISSNETLQVGKSTSDLNLQIESLLETYFIIVVPFLLLSFILALFFAHRFTVQLHELVSTLRKIKAGSFRERARVEGGELKEIANLFNRMMDQIEVLIDKNRDELDHFAHDVKTPITRFKLTAEKALIDRGNHNLALEALEEAAAAADDIIQLISSLFDISLTESGANRLNRTTLELAPLVNEVIEFYEWVGSESGITFKFNFVEGLKVKADRLQLKRVISNLVDNAVKFSRPNSVISVDVLTDQKFTVLKITNKGIGIPSEEIPLVWGRFFRGTSSNATPGFGLGLSFVKVMMEAHGGFVSAESDGLEGATFSISLPLNDGTA